MSEEWAQIDGYENYLVSSLGRVKSLRGKYRIKLPDGYITFGSTDWIGYKKVSLFCKSKKKDIRVHCLVAKAFIPNPDGKKYVNHKDGNKANNHVSNLEWCTHKENIHHAIKLGLMDNRGSNHGMSKVNENIVLEMRRLRKEENWTHQKIADKFGICRRQAGDIVNGVNWGWLP